MLAELFDGVARTILEKEKHDEWYERMLRETDGMKPGEVLEHLAADYEKNGPPPEKDETP